MVEIGSAGAGRETGPDSALSRLRSVAATVPLAARWVASVAREIASLRRRVAELEEEVERDPLTGAWNRRRLNRELSDPGLGPSSLLLVDVDHFKAVNDRHGHARGDEVLVAVARALERAVAPEGRVFRFGGEEFAVLVPGIGPGGVEAARAIRARLADEDSPVTVSTGIAAVAPGGAGNPSPVDLADTALYAAKRAGRDRWAAAPLPLAA